MKKMKKIEPQTLWSQRSSLNRVCYWKSEMKRNLWFVLNLDTRQTTYLTKDEFILMIMIACEYDNLHLKKK